MGKVEEMERARAETVKKLETVETARSKSAEDATSAKESARERDAAVKANEVAVSRIRNLESALQETREELLRAEEEAAQLQEIWMRVEKNADSTARRRAVTRRRAEAATRATVTPK